MEILSFEVTKNILMLDVSVTVSELPSSGQGPAAPSASDVQKSLSLPTGGGEETEKVDGKEDVVNPWAVESDGAIDYLR